MNYPITDELECPPFGVRHVIFDLMDDDDDFFVPEDLGNLARDQIHSSWTKVWTEALPMLEQLLIDYEQGFTVADLLANTENSLNVIVMLPEDDAEVPHNYRFDLFIDKKERLGSIVFGVEFADLEAQYASATF